MLRRRTVALTVIAAIVAVGASLVRGDGRSKLPRDRAPAFAQSDQVRGLDDRGLPRPGAQRAAVRRYLRLGLPIFCGGGRGRYVALTFDDGPGRHTPRLVATLRGAGSHATFFAIGREAARAPELVRQEMRVGAVGAHTWNHPVLTEVSPERAVFEMASAQQWLQLVTGAPVDLFRPPYEARNRSIDARSVRMGMLPILWNVDSADSTGRPGRVISEVVRGLRPGAIILMHETKAESIAALPAILASARRRRLRVVSVPQLLALDPPSDAQVRAGHGGCTRPESSRSAPSRGAPSRANGAR